MTARPAIAAPELTRSTLLERAAKLTHTVRERAARTEELRRVPPESVSDIVEAGLHLIGVPKRFGGLGH